MKQRIVYIVPTYNESENIGQMLILVNQVLSKLKKYDGKILVVDDNSPDGTQNIVKKFQKSHKSTFLLSGTKKGLGKAMIRGFTYATKILKADIIISNEADFSYSPKEVPFMIKKIEDGADVVAGSRRVSDLKNWTFGRRLIHFVANDFFAGVVAGIHEVHDHNSAFKAIRVKKVLSKINFDTFPTGFGFFNYLVFKLSRITPKIFEFTTTFRPRTKGKSKIRVWDAIEYAISCIQIRIEKLS